MYIFDTNIADSSTDICTFEQIYYDYQSKKYETFQCDVERLEGKGLCLFHDESYLKDDNHPENKDNIIEKLLERIENSKKNKTLKCIGFYLPDIKLKEEFTQQVYFNYCKFQNADLGATFKEAADFSWTTFSSKADFFGATFSSKAYFSKATFLSEADISWTTFSSEAHFSDATFSSKADFFGAKFLSEAHFSNATFLSEAHFSMTTFLDKSNFSGKFKDKTYFKSAIFEKPNEVRFEVEDMSMVSFLDTDTTKIRFSDIIRWHGKDNFQVIEETWLEEDRGKSSKEKRKKVRLGGVLSVYRNLRENYEFRRRYDEAGKFFIREMELKRNYREVKSKSSSSGYEIKKNCWFRRNLFSLTGWYRFLSNYGESLWRPTVAGMVIVFLATLFFVCQSNPTLAPAIPFFPSTSKTNVINNTSNTTNSSKNTTTTSSTTNSSFIGFAQLTNGSQWSKAGERGLGDFIPLVTMPSDIKIGFIDYIIKIVGGAVTFGLIAIALRRRFERKYTH